MSFLSNLFGRRNRGFQLFGRRRTDALTARRGGVALGSILSIAAPFVIRKLMARRAAARSAAY